MEGNGEGSAAQYGTADDTAIINCTMNEMCVWYKSQSIEKGNKRWYRACRELCEGKTDGCEKYITQTELEKKLNETEVL